MSVTKAIQGLETDLSNATENHANALKSAIYFESQIGRLNSAIAALKEFSTGEEEVAAPIATAKRGAATGVRKTHKNDMPKTDSAFWFNLITSKHQKTGDILTAATAKLGLTDPEKVAVLKQRMPNALTKLLEEKKIKSEGQRLDRTYFV